MVDIADSGTEQPPASETVRNLKQRHDGHVKSMISMFSLSLRARHNSHGSDPSLISQTTTKSSLSSISASRRTLHSQDSISANQTPAESTNGQSETPNLVASRIHSIESGTFNASHDEPDSSKLIDDSSSKVPSYLKLSCSISGYNKYSKLPAETKNDLNRNLSPSDHSNSNHDGSVTRIQVLSRDDESYRGGKPAVVMVNGHGGRLSGSPVTMVTNGGMCGVDNVCADIDCDSTTCSNSLAHFDASTSSPPSKRRSGVDSDTPLQNGCSTPSEFSTPPSGSAEKQNISTPNKDGAYFHLVVDKEERRLHELCRRTEEYLSSNIPEEACGRLRATIGKANLLTSKKFKQFRGLCDQNMSQLDSEPFSTTAQDLAGFWDMVMLQVEEVGTMFSDIDKMRQNNWNSPIREKNAASRGISANRGKPASALPQTPKSSKSRDAAKAREEARKRLIAAKKAGRQRKASQNDDVEIFVS